MTAHPSKFDLTGRSALVTGGAGLLGPQHAIALAQQGARVVLSDVNLELARATAARLKEELPRATFDPIQLDVTSLESVKACADGLARKGVNIDILINNAAIDPKVTSTSGLMHASRFEGFPLAQWNLELAVGLSGAMLCAQVFGTSMAERGRGVILNIASDLAVFAPDQRLYRQEDGRPESQQPVKPVTYSVIKHGLIGLTKYLATYWADRGVRVNALSPGGVSNGQPAEFVQRLESLIPLGRMAQRDEYRAAVQFLCSDASSYMTGQNLIMDGGRSVW